MRILLLLAALLLVPALCLQAQDKPFAESEQEILRGLTGSGSGSGSGAAVDSPDLLGGSSGRQPTTGSSSDPMGFAFGGGDTRELTILEWDGHAAERKNLSISQAELSGGVNLRVEFDSGSASIRKDSKPILDALGRALSDPMIRQDKVLIRGHTDADGSEEANLTLSLERALAVARYLTDHFKMSSSRFLVQGFGEAAPLSPGSGEDHKQLNRRVEVRLAGSSW